MAKIRPFKAIRPSRDKANLVASRSYLTYSDISLKEKLDTNPYTFLHIINPDYNIKRKSKKSRFKLIKERFSTFINNGILFQEEKDSFYIYQQIKEDKEFTGIIASTAIDDYLNGTIKIHEKTITEREEMFKEYLRSTGFNADPVLLSYKSNSNINSVVNKYCERRSEYEFTTTNGVFHKFWIIDDVIDINIIIENFKEITDIYIADGHHRSASSALLCEEIRENNQGFNPDDDFNYFMSCLIPENQLDIINFNRLIKTTNGLTSSELIKKIEKYYLIEKKGSHTYSPSKETEISMYLERNWHSLTLKRKESISISASLDPSTLSKNILEPILNIRDEKTDKNICFVNGTISLSRIKQMVDNGEFKIAFILKAIKIEELKSVADNDEIMPPKSTYIHPKLRSGLTIYKID